jgi:short-subunit dehydrogenase
MPIGPFVEESDATAKRMIDINLHGVIFGSKLALERFLPLGRGHLVNVASSAGKSGFPGGATYCATKHAVVGLSEALRAETYGTAIEVSCVMPVVVKTELGSGLPEARGFPPVEPEDVAALIVEALQFPRFDVYVPKAVGRLFRLQGLFPRRVNESVSRWLKADKVLSAPDHVSRAAYEARMIQTIAVPESAPTADEPAREEQPV